jgi:hypothetical protein
MIRKNVNQFAAIRRPVLTTPPKSASTFDSRLLMFSVSLWCAAL